MLGVGSLDSLRLDRARSEAVGASSLACFNLRHAHAFLRDPSAGILGSAMSELRMVLGRRVPGWHLEETQRTAATEIAKRRLKNAGLGWAVAGSGLL